MSSLPCLHVDSDLNRKFDRRFACWLLSGDGLAVLQVVNGDQLMKWMKFTVCSRTVYSACRRLQRSSEKCLSGWKKAIRAGCCSQSNKSFSSYKAEIKVIRQEVSHLLGQCFITASITCQEIVHTYTHTRALFHQCSVMQCQLSKYIKCLLTLN